MVLVDWRAANVSHYLERLDSQYRWLWGGAVGLATVVGTIAWNVRPLLDRSALWGAALGALLYFWLGSPAIKKFIANVIPSSTTHLTLEKLTFIRRFLAESGAGSQRILAVMRALPSLVLALAVARLALDGYYPVLGWIFVYNFGSNVLLAFMPYILSRKRIVRIITEPLAALDTWSRNPRAKKLDRRTMAGELAVEDPAKPMQSVSIWVKLLRLGVIIAAPFYIGLAAYLYFGGIRPAGLQPDEVLVVAIAALLAFSALWLVALLFIDTTRALAEQLPQLGGETAPAQFERRSAALMAIDALRENQHGYGRSLDVLLSKHDVVRLWRSGQQRTGR